MRVLWQKLPDGTFAKIAPGGAGYTWPEGYGPVLWKEDGTSITIYVETDGNDDNDGLTEEMALATFAAALDRAKAFSGSSVIIQFGEGEFAWPVTDNHVFFTKDSPIRYLQGEGKAFTRLNSTSLGHSLYVQESSSLRIANLTLKTGVNVVDCSSVRLSGVGIEYTNAYGLYAVRNSALSIDTHCSVSRLNTASSYADLILIDSGSFMLVGSEGMAISCANPCVCGIEAIGNAFLQFYGDALTNTTFTGTYTNKVKVSRGAYCYTGGKALPSPSLVDTANGGASY